MTDKEKLNAIWELVKNEQGDVYSEVRDVLMLGRGKELKNFQKPTIPEIQAYCDERNNGIDGEEFWNHYESKGWKIGKSPMKSWKSAIVTWEKTSKKKEVEKKSYKKNPNQVSKDQRDELLELMNSKTTKMFGKGN